jgi:hypothetical protein
MERVNLKGGLESQEVDHAPFLDTDGMSFVVCPGCRVCLDDTTASDR